MKDVLRAVEGLGSDMVFDLGERMTLGRSAVSDVQLAHPDVSRFHALIERDEKGRSFITDLASKSGTFVDGNRVQRALLRRGTVVDICHYRLRYDTVDERTDATRLPKITGVMVVAQTRETPRAAANVGPNAPKTVTPHRDALLELARAVMEYRVLTLDGVVDTPCARGERMRLLRARLEIPSVAGAESPRRIHHRFPSTGPVLLGIVSGTQTDVRPARVTALGAGGARVSLDDPPPRDAQCWLLVATGTAERSAIGFPAKVVWCDRNRGGIGLAFIGRPIEAADLIPPARGRER